jgi:predicted amidohydrolase YtcJ
MNRHVVVAFLAPAIAAGCHREPPASHIFHRGGIVIVDPQFHVVEAMAIRDGHIVAVGTSANIRRGVEGST